MRGSAGKGSKEGDEIKIAAVKFQAVGRARQRRIIQVQDRDRFSILSLYLISTCIYSYITDISLIGRSLL